MQACRAAVQRCRSGRETRERAAHHQRPVRRHLWAHNRWPRNKHVLYTEGELFELPPHDPELALSALLMPNNRQQRRRRRAIDEPAAFHIASEEQRREALRDILSFRHYVSALSRATSW